MHRRSGELLGFLAVLAAAGARYAGAWFAPGHPFDEAHYFAGFARYAAGESPYALPDVLFPPSFAALGAGLVLGLGERGAALALRGANLLGLAATAWLAGAALERGPRARLLLALAAVLLLPSFAHAMFFGNIGLAAGGAALVALALLPRRPWAAGLALGASLALKPVAAALVLLLATRRATEPRSGRPELVAAGVATAVAALAALAAGPALVSEFAVANSRPWRDAYLLGFGAAASRLGLALPTWLPFALVTGGAIYWLGRRPTADSTFDAIAPAVALAASPIVWLHTLALALPVEVRALAGPRVLRGATRPRLELGLRCAWVGVIWGAGAAGAPLALPGAAGALLAALPVVAALALARGARADG